MTTSITESSAVDSTIAVYDPSTEEQIGEIADGGASAVDEAVGRAREAFRSGAWVGKTPSERSRILNRVADLIEQRADELAEIDSRNVGMARGHARNLVLASAEQVRYNAGWCTKIYGKSSDMKMAGGITGETADLLAIRSRSRWVSRAASCPGTGRSSSRSPSLPRPWPPAAASC